MDEPVDIDLTALAEVQRLLAETDFASIDDLARRLTPSAGASTGADRRLATEASAATAFDGAGAAPLPRRR